MAFELPSLPYGYDALQPFISKETLEYHHDKHHKAYVEAANKLLTETALENKSLEDVIRTSHRDPKLTKLYDNAAQHWNHSEFWLCMKPPGHSHIPSDISKRLDADLGGLEKFKKDFVAQGVADFGSGWVWLIIDSGRLKILSTSNADNPPALGKTALLTCDVWEHAYYIDYRNDREKFLKAFVDNLINWEHVAALYDKATSQRRAA